MFFWTVRRVNYKNKKLQRFESWILLSKKREEDIKSVGPLVKPASDPGLRLAQPGGPTDRLSVLFPPFYLMTKSESSFGNVAIL
jgi:hypothetical protein